MDSAIKGEERTLGKVFSSDFRYVIPSYQRPYAWETEQVEKLIDDIYGAFCEDQDAYFLGSLVLTKTDERTHEVVDGQQRLSSLAMLIAALINSLPGEYQNDDLKKRLYDCDDIFDEGAKAPRIVLRNTDQEVFESIQMLRFADLEKRASETLTDSQQRIRGNMAYFSQHVQELFGNDIEKQKDFIRYLFGQCYVVAVTSASRAAAFRMFSVLNSRGMDLSAIDLIKSQLFQTLTDSEQALYDEKWDEAEKLVGSNGMNEVLTHTRFIISPVKARRSLFEEMQTLIEKSFTAQTFIDMQLMPAVYAYDIVQSDGSNLEDEGAVSALRWLNRIGNSDWVPVALFYFMTATNRENDGAFFSKLERLAAYLQTKGTNVNGRLSRYGQIINEMKQADGGALSSVPSLGLAENEQDDFVELLNSNLYLLPNYRCKYLLLRLNELLAEGPVQTSTRRGTISIEHVLPQTVDPSSEWARTWTPERQDEWRHKLANLVLLTGRLNSAASNYDFERKKCEYFANKNGTVSFALTTQVVHEDEWTPEVVERRQERLTEVLTQHWNLGRQK